jgi:hypothetical protein
MTGWHGEQWDFQSNEKTMEHDFENNETFCSLDYR